MNTMDHLLALAPQPAETLPDKARALALISLFDWLLCGRAGINEPVAIKLRAFADAEGLSGASSLFGGGMAPPRMAAMVNGATSHALDYDDTHFDHVGHLSVGIYPAALAVGEEVNASVTEVADAFLVGAEAAIRIGCILGAAHYNRGFHQTATAGAFGATIAAARLRKLTPNQLRNALGLCASRASGLKSQFGTMGKPLNAGLSAANGVEATALAALGLTSADDGIMGAQGFVPTHTDEIDEQSAWADAPPQQFRFLRNSYKFHACCHGTHAMIEALSTLRQNHPINPQEVSAIELRTNPRWLSVCNIATPRTGLEVKFSYAWLAAMVFHEIPTADDRVYDDALASDPSLRGLASKVTVVGDGEVGDQQAFGTLRTTSGAILPFAHDLAKQPSIEALATRLQAKAHALLSTEVGQLLALRDRFNTATAKDLGIYMRTGR